MLLFDSYPLSKDCQTIACVCFGNMYYKEGSEWNAGDWVKLGWASSTQGENVSKIWLQRVQQWGVAGAEMEAFECFFPWKFLVAT